MRVSVGDFAILAEASEGKKSDDCWISKELTEHEVHLVRRCTSVQDDVSKEAEDDQERRQKTTAQCGTLEN